MKWKRPIGENTAETLYVIDSALFYQGNFINSNSCYNAAR